ncbi:hypothetical protein BCR44DRAFT_1516981 [Catenaria anguillulae PL171]|uniref:Uncharacterized protein n=1 Tax=Catenaria anguillulae PL171 TaxID=765915 RepID=A0A1Y2H9A6_9FUNG|nr:hypothetical protein BCR44DRAFT_1516981 [Catenaria anguillulae PL171]
MPRTKRTVDDDDDYQPQPGSAENDNDDYKDKPTAKRGRRSTNGPATLRSSKASSKSSARIPFVPDAIDDPIPIASILPPLPHATVDDTHSHNRHAAANPPFPWELPVAVPETATNWWQELIELNPGDPDSMAVHLQDVRFTTTTLLSFPDPLYLDPETFAFVGPSDFAFFQVPYLTREPYLRAIMRPKRLVDGRVDVNPLGNPRFEHCTHHLPIDDFAPLVSTKFKNTADDHRAYSKAFNLSRPEFNDT